MNPSNLNSKNELLKNTEIDKELVKKSNFSYAHYAAVLNGTKDVKQPDASVSLDSKDISKDSFQQSQVYSLSRHYEKEQKKKDKKKSKKEKRSVMKITEHEEEDKGSNFEETEKKNEKLEN